MRFSSDLSVGATATRDNKRIIVVALSVLPFSILTLVLPHDAAVRLDIVVLAIVIGAAVTVSAFFSDRAKSRGWTVPMWLTFIDLSGMTVAAGLAIYAASGKVSIYNQLLLVILIIFAMWADAKLLMLGSLLSTVTLVTATLAGGIPIPDTIALTLEYIVCVGIAIVIVFLLVGHLRDEREVSVALALRSRALAAVAEAGVRFTDLQSALDSCCPLIHTALTCDRVEVISFGTDSRPVSLTSYPRPATGTAPRSISTDIALVLRATTIRIEGSTVYLPVGELEGDAAVLVIEGYVASADGDGGADFAALSSVRDVVANMIERASILASLQRLSRTDPLTGLANRRALTDRLQHDVGAAGRSGRPLSVVMIDIDHFKVYNDTHGHLAGDNVLKAVASVLHDRVRSSADMVARFGGEEFCLCLPDTDASGALKLVDDQRRRVGEIAADPPLSFSAGIATWDGSQGRDELLQRADEAMYRAKANGRNRVIIHDDPRHEHAVLD